MLVMAVFFVLICLTVNVFAYEAHYGPSGLIYYDKDKSFQGYTLYYPDLSNRTYLIDMNGNVVHTWPACGNPILLENGELFGMIGVREHAGSEIGAFDWQGKKVWTIKAPEGMAFHHDWRVINDPKRSGPTVMTIARVFRTKAEAEEAGSATVVFGGPGAKEGFIDTDALVEFDMEGNIVWMWEHWDHFVQDEFPDKGNYVKSTRGQYGRFDMNYKKEFGLSGDYNHSNSFDYNPILDQVVINGFQVGEFYVIDHSTTIEEAKGPKGDFVYRWGAPYLYGEGIPPGASDPGHNQTMGGHSIHWIDEGLPGEGNFLWFNNWLPGIPGQSRVLEINPYDGPMSKGIYIHETEAGYKKQDNGISYMSNQITWSYYTGKYTRWARQGFLSTHIAGAQRLPNSNTLICSGEAGHLFEVTPKDEVVWEFINPFIQPRKKGGEGVIKKVIGPGDQNPVFRAIRYTADYPGLEGIELKPVGPLNEPETWEDHPAFSSGGGGSVGKY